MSFSGTPGWITKPPPGTPINPFHPLSQGLVGQWMFNEGAGSRAQDISGHGNHGTLMNMLPNVHGSGWGGSKFGGGLQFDGVDDYVDCGNNKILDITSASSGLTIELYLKPVSLPAETSVLRKGSIGCNNYNFFIYNSKLALLSSSECDWGHAGTNSIVTIGERQHIAVTWDSNTSDVKYYINGRLMDTIGNWNIGAINTDPLQFGHQQFGSPGWLDSMVEYIRLYSCPLDAKDIKMLCLDPFCNMLRSPIRYVAAAGPAGAIMNQFQRSNIGADLYNGGIIA